MVVVDVVVCGGAVVVGVAVVFCSAIGPKACCIPLDGFVYLNGRTFKVYKFV